MRGKVKRNQQKCDVNYKKCNVTSFLVRSTLNSLDAIINGKTYKLSFVKEFLHYCRQFYKIRVKTVSPKVGRKRSNF